MRSRGQIIIQGALPPPKGLAELKINRCFVVVLSLCVTTKERIKKAYSSCSTNSKRSSTMNLSRSHSATIWEPFSITVKTQISGFRRGKKQFQPVLQFFHLLCKSFATTNIFQLGLMILDTFYLNLLLFYVLLSKNILILIIYY